MASSAPCLAGQVGGRLDADAHDDNVGREPAAVVERDDLATLPVALEGGGHGVQSQIHAVAAVKGKDFLTERRRHGAAQQAAGAFEHGDLAATPAGRCSNLQPDEATTDDQQVRPRPQERRQRGGIIERAQPEEFGLVGTGHVQTAQVAAGGDQQRLVGDAALGMLQPTGDHHLARSGVDAIDRGHDAVDRFGVSVGGQAQHARRRALLAGEHALGQRRALVRRVRLGSDHDDRPLPAELAQGLGGAAADMAGTHRSG